MSSAVRPKNVLVIGAGPAGLVTLRNLIERGNFERVELVERRDDVGGVWYLDDTERSTAAAETAPRWPSPAYPGLIGNVLPDFLSFSLFPFPPLAPHQPFPTLSETHEYLRTFATPYLRSNTIRLNTEVVRVEELEKGSGWKVILKDWTKSGQGEEAEEVWDAVVVAIGWYDNPVWPNTPGMEELREKNLAQHAKWWQGPEGYAGKKVIVIGNANSSNDIAAQLAPVTEGPVYQSIRRPAFPGFPSLPDERIVMVAPVSKYSFKTTSDGDKVDVLLFDGTEITDVDIVLCGTGYRLIPEFVNVRSSENGTSQFSKLSSVEGRVPSLHRFILYAYNPSLAFIGACLPYTPFTIADVSSTWLTLAWSGDLPYPTTPEGRLIFEKDRIEAIRKIRSEMENPSSLMMYSILGKFEQEYASAIKADIITARPELKGVLPEWNDERTQIREAMFATKFEALKYAKSRGNEA